MKVRFDSLNRYEHPNFIVCNPGSVFNEDQTLTRIVGPLVHTSDEEVELNFNTISTLSLRVNKVEIDEPDECAQILAVYDKIKNRRLIFVDDIGFFVITDVEECHEAGEIYKDVTASSCEIEIQRKGLVFIEDGTYKFVDLFEKIVSSIPKWTIEYIDPNVAERYRTFEDVDIDMNTLDFMMEDMQDAYECIFVFDTIHRRISVYDQHEYIVRTDIHLSEKDLIESIEMAETSDDLYTALTIFGDNELTISSVNPIGTSTVYDFSYYLDWMSDGLRSKVEEWSSLVEEKAEEYYSLNCDYYEKVDKKSNIGSEVDALNTQKAMYQKARENIVAEAGIEGVDIYNDAIEENGGDPILIMDSIEKTLENIDALIAEVNEKIAQQEELLKNVEASMLETRDKITAIHDLVSIEKFFSEPEEYDELFDYIYEGRYTDEYITTTDSMTMSERLAQMRELYLKAKRVIKSTSSPNQEFSVDVEDFVFDIAFKHWSEQLEAGCLINVELDSGEIAELFLTNLQLNWGDGELSLTFGNKFNKTDPQSLYNNVLGDIEKSANTLNYIKELIYPVKSGKIEDIEGSIESSKILTASNSVASPSGEVVIDGGGYTGKKATDDGFEEEQLKITSNSLVITTDSWKSSTPAIGYVRSGGHVYYGVNAAALVGTASLGQEFKIVDENGVELTVLIKNISEAQELLSDKVDTLESELTEAINELSSEVSDNTENISKIQTTIGIVPEGTTIVQMIESAKYDDTKIKEDISKNAQAIEELRELIESMSEDTRVAVLG